MSVKQYVTTILLLLAGGIVLRAGDTLKVMSYNLRYGELASMEQFADSISSVSPDVVLLQECDWSTHRKNAPAQHGVKFVNVLAYHTGMFGVFGKAIDFRGGYYGLGILSRYPIIRTERVLLPWDGKTEQRCLLVADIELPSGKIVTVASTHLEVRNDALRVTQAKFINRYFKHNPYPVILSGDMNAELGSPEILLLQKQWKDCTDSSLTFSTYKLEVKIDYIFAKPENKVRVLDFERIDRFVLSDHYPIMASLAID